METCEGLMDDSGDLRTFASGATRGSAVGKIDFEGALSPIVLERYAEFMDGHCTASDGSERSSDNWQKGIPLRVYMKSGFRHFFAWWRAHRRGASPEYIEETLCSLLFNVMGYLHVLLSRRYVGLHEPEVSGPEGFEPGPGD